MSDNIEQLPIEVIAEILDDVSTYIGFDSIEWEIIQGEADEPNGLRIAGDFILSTMKKAIDGEEEIVAEKTRINKLCFESEGYYRFSQPEKASQKGLFSHIYETNSDNPISAYIFNDASIRPEIVEYLLDNQLIYCIGKIEYQGTLHTAYAPR